MTAMSPQVAGQNVLSQAAQQQAATQAGLGALTFDPTTGAVTGAGQGTGIAGYQPFLQQAQQYSGPGSYQQFMSPYQQDVINTTLTEYDRQRQIAQRGIASQAIQAGAFGGGREGVQQAEFDAQSLQNRAALQAQLLQQGYGQAQQAAGTAFSQQQTLAALQPTLAAQTSQQLGAAGTSNLAYQQAVLDAQRQAAQFAYQEPYQRLSVLGSGITSLLAGQPSTPYSQVITPTGGGVQQQVSPLSQALSTAANVYGLGSIFGGR
jgi:hypothetical protein